MRLKGMAREAKAMPSYNSRRSGMRFGLSTVAATALWVAAMAAGVTASSPRSSVRLYVGNSGGDDITVIDLDTLKVIGNIKVGAQVHGMAVQPDGRRLFTTIESERALKIIDTATDRVTAVIKLTGRPNQCAVTPDGRYVGVPIRDADSVDVVDVRQRKVVKVLPVKLPHNCFNAASDRYIFVSSMGDDEIDKIDLAKLEYAEKFPVGGVPRPFVVTNDGRRMYVALSNLHGFAVVDLDERKEIQRVRVPAEHTQARERPFEPADTLTHGLALSPDGREVWLTSLLDNCIYVYDLGANRVTSRIPTGDGPNWVAFSPDGRYFCVSNPGDGDCGIIDVGTRREVARLKAGRLPKRLVVAVVPGDAGGNAAVTRP